MRNLIVLTALVLAACGSRPPTEASAPLQVQYTFAAQAWLPDVTDCATQAPVVPELRSADFLNPAEDALAIRIGVPVPLLLPAYQIASEDVVVVIHPQNPISSLTEDQVRGLFSGAISNWDQVGGSDRIVQVWIFAAGEDVQQVFESAVMQGAPVVSSARLATGPDDLATSIGSDPGAIGLLTRHWAAANVRTVYTAATVPVIVLTTSGADPKVQAILNCLQR
jgi:hypothetical protein